MAKDKSSLAWAFLFGSTIVGGCLVAYMNYVLPITEANYDFETAKQQCILLFLILICPFSVFVVSTLTIIYHVVGDIRLARRNIKESKAPVDSLPDEK